MSIQDDVTSKATEIIGDAEYAYNKAETEVDGFFARNKFTVLILSGVAIALVVLSIKAFF